MDFLKSVAGKLVTGAVILAVFAAGLAWYQMDPSARDAITGGAVRIVGWLLIVLAVPWALFAVISWVAKKDSNTASGIFVLALTVVEAVVLAWMFQFGIAGGGGWTFFAVGVVLAGVYNLLACDWIAERWG